MLHALHGKTDLSVNIVFTKLKKTSTDFFSCHQLTNDLKSSTTKGPIFTHS